MGLDYRSVTVLLSSRDSRYGSLPHRLKVLDLFTSLLVTVRDRSLYGMADMGPDATQAERVLYGLAGVGPVVTETENNSHTG